MSKNKQNEPIAEFEVTPPFKLLTHKDGQEMVKNNMSFTHNLLKRKNLVPGILTVATIQDNSDGELLGEGSLNCAQDQYYMLLVSAISTILSAMDEHGALKSLGISTDDLSFETLGFVVGAIEDKLGLEIGDDEELDRLVEKDENILDFLDNHYTSLLRLGGVEDED